MEDANGEGFATERPAPAHLPAPPSNAEAERPADGSTGAGATHPSGVDAGQHRRDGEVLDLALRVGIEELKESSRLLEPVKTRVTAIFAAVLGGLAFLAGTALRDLDRDSFNPVFLYGGIGSFALFAMLAVLLLLMGKRNVFLSGLYIRDVFVQQDGEWKNTHVWDSQDVVNQVVFDLHQQVAENVASLYKVRKVFVAFVVAGAFTIGAWSLLVAFASPLPSP